MFLFMILWSLLFAGKQALSNVKNIFTNVGGNVSDKWGVKPSNLPSSLLVVVFFCIFVRASDFFGVAVIGCFSSFVLDGSFVGVF